MNSVFEVGYKVSRRVEFKDLSFVDLVTGTLYKGGTNGNVGDDPISKLLKCGNQGGFRYIGSIENNSLKYVVLYSSLADQDWPDYLDEKTGQFIYYGDNKVPGKLLYETSKKGNLILKSCFDFVYNGKRDKVLPFFVFTKGGVGRDVIFRGIAVPGSNLLKEGEDLVALWKPKYGTQFQNYKSTFTILNEKIIVREWIDDLINGQPFTNNAPQVWTDWIRQGIYKPLVKPRST